MITYSWDIISLERTSGVNEQPDIVKNVTWNYTGTNEDGIKFSVGGRDNLQDPDPENFILYNDITKEQVIVWIESLLDLNLYNNLIETGINNSINPPRLYGVPWDAAYPETVTVEEIIAPEAEVTPTTDEPVI